MIRSQTNIPKFAYWLFISVLGHPMLDGQEKICKYLFLSSLPLLAWAQLFAEQSRLLWTSLKITAKTVKLKLRSQYTCSFCFPRSQLWIITVQNARAHQRRIHSFIYRSWSHGMWDVKDSVLVSKRHLANQVGQLRQQRWGTAHVRCVEDGQGSRIQREVGLAPGKT